MSEKISSFNTNPEVSSANIQDMSEFQSDQTEAFDAAVAALGSAFHEDWRKTRLDSAGNFEPRVKSTSDEAWIEAHGTDQVDIANTSYGDLPADWKAENQAAAEVVVAVFEGNGGVVDLSDETVRNAVGARVHDAWLSRNEWAKGGDLDVPFEDLPDDEKAKDLSQVEIAVVLFE